MTPMRPTQQCPPVSARVLGLEPIAHGGASASDLAREGIDADRLIDLSTNVHPFGPPASVNDILSRVSLDRYPDHNAARMRAAMACRLGVTPDQVVAGNGSVELIYLLAQVYLDRGDRVVVSGPTFGEYTSAARFCGAEVVEYRASSEDGFQVDLDELAATIRRARPKLVFCCNPNNPTGQVLDQASMEFLVEVCVDAGGMLVVDEAYRSLTDRGTLDWSSVDLLRCGPVVLLRSLTKEFALPGLRLGYAVTSQEVGAILNTVRLPWGVNVIAEEIGCHLLGETDYLARCRERLAIGKAHLLQGLDTIEAEYVPSVANYLLIRVGGPDRTAADCRYEALGHGIIVRDCANFGLSDYIRVSVHSREATDRLCRCLAQWLAARDAEHMVA